MGIQCASQSRLRYRRAWRGRETGPGAAVRQALSDWDMTAFLDDAELLTSKLAANAAEHASGPIGLAICRHNSPSGRAAITCEVTDSSPDIQTPEPADSDRERGRGLGIVAATAWANGIAYQPGGKTISFTLIGPAAADRRQPEPESELEAAE